MQQEGEREREFVISSWRVQYAADARREQKNSRENAGGRLLGALAQRIDFVRRERVKVHGRASEMKIAATPPPPYYAVIFTSLRTEGDNGYGPMAERMLTIAADQPGFLGVESARGTDGLGITVSYWESEESIAAWKAQSEHRVAQETGRRKWYAEFQVRVAKVERAYGRPSQRA
jgi:heme-degrading monooxygenase HmoA